MLRVALVNMPFAQARRPSLALAQLRSVVRANLAGRAECDIFHLNVDFVKWFGPPDYAVLAGFESLAAGLGDWFFSRVAFPEAPDNAASYSSSYPVVFGQDNDRLLAVLSQRRPALPAFLDELIDRHQLDRYEVVGFTSMFQQNVASLALARRLKERNPGIVTVMGGANCETPMGQVIARNVPQIDFVFSGCSLTTFPKFVEHLADGRVEASLADIGYFFMDESAHPAYAATMTKWMEPLRELVAYWRMRWLVEDGKLRPELRFVERPEGRAVYDSRSGEAEVLELDPVAIRILERLAAPLPEARLPKELPDVAEEELRRQLGHLRDHRLLFADGDRLLSLVTGGEPPAAAAFSPFASPKALRVLPADPPGARATPPPG